MKHCIVINPGGTWEWKYLDFTGAQQAVGGYVQLVHLGGPLWAYLNEEGIMLKLPDNMLATKLVVACGNNVLYDRAIRGPMILIGRNGTRDCPDVVNGQAVDEILELCKKGTIVELPTVVREEGPDASTTAE